MTCAQRLTAAFMAVAWLVLPAAAHAQKMVLVVRHAERADGASGAAPTGADPPLSAIGEARALKLAAMLENAGIQAIFVSEFKRTRSTAQPLAEKLGLSLTPSPAADAARLVSQIKTGHTTDVVLVVGHSNTIPAILKAFGGPAVTISDNEYDNLFIIVPATGAMTRIRY